MIKTLYTLAFFHCSLCHYIGTICVRLNNGAPGGWQWFAVQLEDGTEVMVTESRDQGGEVSALYGTYVDA